MSRKTKSSKINAPDGILPVVQAKSRHRREKHKTLAALQDGPRRRNDLSPTIAIEYLPPTSLFPAKRRIRQSNSTQAARIDRSLAEFGICVPILIDRQRQIVHGHEVWAAALRAGLETVPVVAIEHLNEAQCRTLAITLNRLGETGHWDEIVLADEFSELLDLGEDLLATGFELAEIDALLLNDDEEEALEEDIPEPGAHAVSRPGDLWLLDDHRLLQGDALDPESYRQIIRDDESIRLVLTDEPFNVPIKGHVTGQHHHREFAMAHGELSTQEFAEFNRRWMENALGYLMDGGLLGTFIDWRSVELVLACGRELGLDLVNIIVWSKPNAGQGSLWRSAHELLPIFKKGSAKHVNNVDLGRHGRWRSNVWSYAGATTLGSDAREGLSVHPTVKPRALLEDALLDVTERRDLVLDPFVGSGSTLLAAEMTGRSCRAIEIEGRYCDVTIQRWQELSGKSAVLAGSGETFLEVGERRREHGNCEERDNGEKD